MNTDDSSNENIKKNKSKNYNEKIIIDNNKNNDAPQNNTNSSNTSKHLLIPYLIISNIKNFNNADLFKDNIKSININNISHNINSETKYIQTPNVEPNNRNNNDYIKKYNLIQNYMNCFNLSRNCNNNNFK